MFCPKCGAQNRDTAKFCAKCGEPIAAAQESPQMPVQDPVLPADDFVSAEVTTPVPVPVPGQVSSSQPSSRGAFGRAWDDWKSSPSKWVIALKLAAAGLIPFVGSLISDGYAYTWGKERALGKNEAMARKLIRPGVMDTGLYVFLTGLGTAAMGFVLSLIVSSVFTETTYFGGGLSIRTVSGLGILLLVVGTFFLQPLFTVMHMRAAICGRVRSGFNVTEAWKIYTGGGRLGKFLAACWLPGLIKILLEALVLIVFILLASFFGVAAAGVIGGALSSSSSYSAAAAVGSTLAMLAGLLPLVVVGLFAAFFIDVMIKMVTARAYGYLFEELSPATWEEYRANSGYYSDQAV